MLAFAEKLRINLHISIERLAAYVSKRSGQRIDPVTKSRLSAHRITAFAATLQIHCGSVRDSDWVRIFSKQLDNVYCGHWAGMLPFAVISFVKAA